MNADQFEPASHDAAVPITQKVYMRLRQAIIHNELAPGDRISESEIARLCDVSRQPVREAFIRLAGESLLSIKPQRGTTITRIGYSQVLDARFLREAIEADIVSILAAAPDPEVVRELRGQIEAQRTVATNAPQDFISLDDRFHRTLAEAAGKTGAWHVIDGQRAQLDRVRFLSACRAPVDKLVEQHATLIDCIETGDVMGANATLRRHVRELLSDLPEIYTANPASFEVPEGAVPQPVNAPLPPLLPHRA